MEGAGGESVGEEEELRGGEGGGGGGRRDRLDCCGAKGNVIYSTEGVVMEAEGLRIL